FEPIELGTCDPAEIAHVPCLWAPRRDPASVEMELDRVFFVVVANGIHLLAHFNRDAQTMPHLACQGRDIGLARLYLATGKFPEQRQNCRLASLCHEVTTVFFDDGRYDNDGT